MYTFINRSIFVLCLAFISLSYSGHANSASPTISSIVDQFGDVSTVITVNFSVDDVDTDVNSLTLSATSSNQVILRDDKFIFGGSGTNRDVRLKPAPDLSGTTTITIMVSDGQSESSESFEFDVGTVTSGAAPSISIINDQNTEISTPITVNFSVDDVDTDVNSLTLSATSSNQVILRDDKFIFGGSGTNRDVRLKPAPDLSGTTTITIMVSDGQSESSESFEFEVGTPVSAAPTITTIDDQFTEVSVVKIVDFFVDDVDTDVDTLVLSGTSSDQTLLPDSEVILEGTGSDRSVRLRPTFGMAGKATVVITAADAQNETSESFEFQVGSSNTQPTIDDIDNQITEEDMPMDIVFNVTDLETSDAELGLSVTTDNSDLLPIENISFENNGASRTATLSPVGDQVGFVAVEITVTDGDNLQRTDGFVLEVTRVNDQPTIEPITSQTINEDGFNVIVITVDDVDNTNGLLAVTAVSNDQNLLPDTNIVIEGATSDRSMTLTPAPGQSGTTTIAVVVDDGEAQEVTVFAVTVIAENDVPTIENLNDQYIAQGTTSEFTFQVKDEEMSDGELDVQASSNNTEILSNENISIQTSGANRTITLNPAANRAGTVTVTITAVDDENTVSDSFKLVMERVDIAPEIELIDSVSMQLNSIEVVVVAISDEDNANDLLAVTASSSDQVLLPDGSIVITGGGSSRTLTITPMPEQTGQVTVTATVTDPQGGQDEESFVLTVNENSVPTIDDIGPQVTNEDFAKVVTFQVGDIETPDNELDVVWASSNDTLLPNNKITMSENGASRTITMTPVDNQYGSSTITVSVSDGDKEHFDEFLLTVTSQNDLPTITNILPINIVEDDDKTVDFSVGDVETAAGSLDVIVATDNANLLPLGNITLDGTGANRTVKLDPLADQFGTAMVRLTVDDGEDQQYTEFTVTVTDVNDAPEIAEGANVTLDTTEDEARAVVLNASDVEGDTLTWEIHSQGAKGTAMAAGTGIFKSVMYTPTANEYGADSFVVKVSDEELSDTITVNVTIAEVNDLPTINKVDDVNMLQGGSAEITISVADIETSVNDLEVLVGSDNDQLLSDANLILTSTGGTRTLTITPPESSFGLANITVIVEDEEGEQASRVFAVNVTAVTPAWAKTGGAINDRDLLDITVPESNFTGAMPGSAGVSGGSASYSIPIQLPPGRNGMQPSVAINYSSRAGNGLAGVGFNLSAGEAISRCSATLAQDGFTTGIKFDKSTDKLCLNGQRLIAVSTDEYGSVNSVYRPEMDNMTKVTLVAAHMDDASAYFEVVYGDGRRSTFGADVQSRVTPADTTSTLSWQATQTFDASGNNFMSYTYEDFGMGENLLKTIRYTGTGSVEGTRAVEFEYETKLNPRYSYLAGTQSQSTMIVSEINTFINNTTPVRGYTLRYEESAYSSRSLLTEVQECSYYNSSDCRSATVFNWSDTPQSVVFEPLGFGNGTAYPDEMEIYNVLPRGDVNGDGVRDWNGIFVNAEGEQTGTTTTILKPCYQNYLMRTPICVDADFNMDGRTDDWRNVNNKLEIKYTGTANWIDTNITLDSKDAFAVNYMDGHIKHVADYNGDRWPDLLVYTFNNYEPTLTLHLHTGNVTAPYLASGDVIYRYPTNVGNTSGNPITESTTTYDIQLMGDLDGNGLPDMILTDKGISNNYAPYQQPKPTQIWYNNGGSSEISFTYVDFTYNNATVNMDVFFTYFIDLNADGLSDWIGWQNYDDSTHYLVGRLNQGNQTFGSEFTIDVPNEDDELAIRYAFSFTGQSDSLIAFPRYATAFKVADINGDGRVEILTPGIRAVEGCSIVYSYNNPSGARLCGNALYANYRNTSDFESAAMIDSEAKDDSIYQWDALYIEQTGSNSFSLRRKATSFYGHAYRSAMVDAFGNGFASMVSVFGLQYTDNSFETDGTGTPLADYFDNHGVYISRNAGAVENTAERYRPYDMLDSVEDEEGLVASWQYRPLTTGEFALGGDEFYEQNFDYTGQFDADDNEYFHFASSMYTVAQFDLRNGLGGYNASRYRYKAAVYNTMGRGFQGFREITVDDEVNQSRNVSIFQQKFPFTGMLERAENYGLNSDSDYCLISASDVTAERNSAHQFTHGDTFYNMYVQSSVTTRFPLNTGASCSGIALSIQTQQVDEIDDYGNIVEQSNNLQEYFDGYTHEKSTITKSYITIDTNTWFVNRLDKTEKIVSKIVRSGSDPLKSAADALDAARTITTTYSNYNNHRKPELVSTFADDNISRTLIVASDFNDYGLPNWIEQRGQVYANEVWTDQNRRTSFTYSNNGNAVAADGYFPYTVTNALGHVLTTTTDISTGQPLTVTDANGVAVSTTYDGFGRAESVIATGVPTQYMAYQQASGDNNAPDYAEWKQVSVQMGSPEQTAYFDIFNRPLRTTVENFAGDGTYITDIEYDARGLNAFESAPYETGNSRYGTRYTAYDSLGRLTGKSVDQVDTSLVTRYIHSGFTTTIEAGNLPDMTRSYNSLNQLLHTQDADSGETHYAYDSMGNPIVIRDANGNDIKASYNGLGHKLYVDDPNMGRTDFINNSFGEVENENDANGDVLDYTYDTLGRLTVRTTTQVISGVPDSTAVFVWDNVASGCKKGLLCSETENGMSRAYQYDSASRITQTTTTLDGTPYVTTQHYDGNYGRPKALVYPNELTVGLDYNLQGYLTSENNAASGYVYRTVSAMDAFGNIAEASISDDILSGTYLYSQKTGQMLSSVVEQGSSVVHELNYSDYDEFGNIKTQSNLVTGTSETFNYDNLHRLTSNVAKDNGATIQSITYDYDAVGNFKYKSDYSTTASNAYQYGENGAGPNAVSTVVKPSGPVNFGYDAKGNMTSGDDLNATYTAYGKPYSLTKNGAASTFSYGSDRARFKQQKGSDTTYYIDKLFEVEGNDWRAYISDVAVIKHSETSGTIDTQIRFLHRDRLGSAETLTDHNGQVTERRRFDPFGKPRGINSESLLPARLSSFGTDVDISKRGFTDHEHLDEQELIHMNGRVYDYNVGRFMSVDPFIQSPGNSQSINPYSYIMNNPLGGIDPTGYRACKATGSNIASECGSGDGHEDNSSTKVVNGGAKGNGAKITSASIIATWQSTLDLENQQKVASTEPEPTVENEGGVKSDPLANKNQQADNNGTEVASNNTSFESIVEKKWKRVFEDGKSVTKTDKVGEEKLLSEEAHGGFLNGLGTLLDKTKLLRGPLAQAVTFDVIYQEYGVFEQWELIEIPKLIQVTRVGEYQYHTRTIGIGNERKTGRKEWRFTNRYTDLDWRVIGCLFTCAPVTGMMKEND